MVRPGAGSVSVASKERYEAIASVYRRPTLTGAVESVRQNYPDLHILPLLNRLENLAFKINSNTPSKRAAVSARKAKVGGLRFEIPTPQSGVTLTPNYESKTFQLIRYSARSFG